MGGQISYWNTDVYIRVLMLGSKLEHCGHKVFPCNAHIGHRTFEWHKELDLLNTFSVSYKSFHQAIGWSDLILEYESSDPGSKLEHCGHDVLSCNTIHVYHLLYVRISMIVLHESNNFMPKRKKRKYI